MRNVLLIVVGMGVMYILLKILSGSQKPESNSSSATSQTFMALAKTGQAMNLVKTNEFRQLVQTPEFRKFISTLAEDQIHTIANTLVR